MQYVRTDVEGLNIITDSTLEAHRTMTFQKRIRGLQDALAFMVGACCFEGIVIAMLAWRLFR